MSLIHNERVKLTATFLNGFAIATVATGVVAPTVAIIFGFPTVAAVSPFGFAAAIGAWFFFGIGLHLLARSFLKRLSE